MKPRIIEDKRFMLAGMDFYGYPYEKAGGWSPENAIGKLWNRFTDFCEENEGKFRHRVSEIGYELWIDEEKDKGDGNEHIFVGAEVDCLCDLPLQLVAKVLPRSRYAVFTLKGDEIIGDWQTAIEREWLPDSGLQQSHDFIIEAYDPVRFRGPHDSKSELDIYVPVR